MQFNLFDWIREGVKRSVMLGVSDAMETIGSPSGDDGAARFAQLLTVPSGGTAAPAIDTGLKRKRLGRSLHDVEQSRS